MASPATSVICRRWPSGTNGRRSLTSSSPTMQELVDLSLIGKQLHWAMVGTRLPAGARTAR